MHASGLCTPLVHLAWSEAMESCSLILGFHPDQAVRRNNKTECGFGIAFSFPKTIYRVSLPQRLARLKNWHRVIAMGVHGH